MVLQQKVIFPKEMEFDGINLFEFMAKSGKTIEQLIAEVYEIVGEFSFERVDLHLTEELKGNVIENCKNGTYSSFGDYKVLRTENIDGYKYFLKMMLGY